MSSGPGAVEQAALFSPAAGGAAAGDGAASRFAPGSDGRGADLAAPPVRALLRRAVDLGATETGGPLSSGEEALLAIAETADATPAAEVAADRAAIRAGADPLGDALIRLWPANRRRAVGAFYTQPALVEPMLDWVLRHDPDRLVDPGCGSGRFAVAAVRRRPRLAVVAVDLDPVATLLTRAALAAAGARDATVLQADYTTLELECIGGRTAFVGNPPYVRHHDLSPAAKRWAVATGRKIGHPVSALAGLHAHFFLATTLHARPGDVGCFVTSAEWLDVNYGSIVRALLLDGLGGRSIEVVDPRAVPFADAMTTAAITCFDVGATPDAMRLRLVASPADLTPLATGSLVATDHLNAAARWSPLIEGLGHADNLRAFIPLGDIAAVHRGIATGANRFFVLDRQEAHRLGITAWCRPAITSAHEILNANGVVSDSIERRLLLDVPADVDRSAHPALDAYLNLGEQPQGTTIAVAERYLTSHRHPWWHLGATTPPPIVASYMARRPPAFALNPDGLAVINIAHGIYPSRDMPLVKLEQLVTLLNEHRTSYVTRGRRYQGGLVKFEPSEMAALLVPEGLVVG